MTEKVYWQPIPHQLITEALEHEIISKENKYYELALRAHELGYRSLSSEDRELYEYHIVPLLYQTKFLIFDDLPEEESSNNKILVIDENFAREYPEIFQHGIEVYRPGEEVLLITQDRTADKERVTSPALITKKIDIALRNGIMLRVPSGAESETIIYWSSTFENECIIYGVKIYDVL